MRRSSRFAFAVSAVALSWAAGPAWAQSQPQPQEAPSAPQDQASDNSALDEIVVTARRTEERLQTVPVAVTAYSQEDLRQRGVATATDLQNFTPSLSVVGGTSRNQESFTIRGVGATAGLPGAGAGPGVVAYFAEVPSSASGPGVMFDLQSIGVLKGPQGTLFGRNTTGGAVLLEPTRPDFDSVSGYVEGSIGDYAARSGNAAINIPLVKDVLAIRAAGQFEKRDGAVTDIVTGRDYNNRNNWSGRIGITFNPTDSFHTYTVLNYVDVDENGPGIVLLAVNPASPYASLLQPLLAAQQARGNDRISLSTVTKDQQKNLLVLNNSELSLSDHVTIRNIFSYNRVRANWASDGDASPLVINDLRGSAPGRWNEDYRTITEELRLQLSFDRFTFQAGGFLLDNKTVNPMSFVSDSSLGAVTQYQDAAFANGASRAVFGQVSYKLTDKLTATAGARWTWDKFDGSISIYIPQFGNACATAPGQFAPNCLASYGGDSDAPSWNLGLDWKPDGDTLAYIATRRGYKNGGVNPAVLLISPDDPLFRFRPETVTDVELGFKRDWRLGGGVRARTNAAAFYSWYNDVQRNDYALIGGFNTQVTANAAKATIKGVEFEGRLIPTDSFSLGVTYSYNDAAYGTYVDPLGIDRSGYAFPYVPRHKFSIDAQLKLPVPESAGEVSVRADYGWQSRQQVAADQEPFDTIDPYGVLNLRLDWNRVAGSGFDASIFAKNVGNVDYRVTSNPTYFSSGLVGSVYGDPRLYGASLRYRF